AQKDIEGAEGTYLGFETLTFVPLDRRLIDKSLLTQAEIEWIDAYHRQVREILTPQLDGEDRAWVERETKPL
ncbi:MAG: M24 family metallopeptidase C-terminal domain-containing protein, partial [Erythrobacter sp.]